MFYGGHCCVDHCCSVRAQEFNAGIFGGVTASQVDGDSYGGYNKLGFTAGVFVNREIDNNILLATGV